MSALSLKRYNHTNNALVLADAPVFTDVNRHLHTFVAPSCVDSMWLRVCARLGSELYMYTYTYVLPHCFCRGDFPNSSLPGLEGGVGALSDSSSGSGV